MDGYRLDKRQNWGTGHGGASCPEQRQRRGKTYWRTSLSTSGRGRSSRISHAEAIRGSAGKHVSGQVGKVEVRHHAKKLR